MTLTSPFRRGSRPPPTRVRCMRLLSRRAALARDGALREAEGNSQAIGMTASRWKLTVVGRHGRTCPITRILSTLLGFKHSCASAQSVRPSFSKKLSSRYLEK